MKQRILALVLVMLMLLSVLPAGMAAEAAPAAADVYVSPTGDDANDGTQAKPVATLARAAELARGKSGAETVTVSVAAGKYFMAEPLKLGAADSNVSWTADGEVILTGAKDLGQLTWTAYRDGIYVADVEKGLAMDQLFVGGQEQILARYPNYDAGQSLQGSTTAANIKTRSAGWADPTGGYIRALHSHKWGGNSYRITGKADTALGVSYTWVGDNNRGSGMHSSYVMVENIFEELDSANEWYYDSENGKLYLMPGEGMTLEGAAVEGAVTEELIHIAGVTDGDQARNITFTGFTLENTKRTMFTGAYVPLMRSDWCVVRSGALFMQDAENITFRDGTIRNIGGNAVFMSGHNDGNVITNNEIYNIGSSGILIAGMPDSCREPSFWEYSSPLNPETDTKYVHKTTIEDTESGPIAEHYPKNCTVSQNHIKNVGIWEKQSSHVALSVAYKISIVHNTIHVGPRAGINVGDGTFGGHEIAYNDVFDVQKETDDHGMFNSWGRDRFWSLGGFDTGGNKGTDKEPYSRIDCIDTIKIHDNRMHFGGRVDGGSTFGIDLDDGSTNYEIYNNLCLNMGIKLREGFHRRVYNNIIVNGQFNLHCTFADSYDEIHSNIVIKGTPYALAATNQSRFQSSRDVIEKNWFYDLGMKVTLPAFWSAVNYESGSIVGTADPQFRDPEHNDYTVLNAEAAASVGFVNFPMDQFGKTGCEDVCPIYVKTSPDSTVDVLERENWLGATISALDDAIMSSTGAGSLKGVYVEEVPENAEAARYGLQSGDVLHSINGVELTKKSEFVPSYDAQRSGDLVHLTIIRNQLPMELSFLKDGGGVDMVDDRDSRVVYGGSGWDYAGPDRNPSNAADCYNQTMTYKNLSEGMDGVYVELGFTGNRVVFYGRKEKNMGDYRIVITDKTGKEVVSTTASAYIADGRPDFVSIYDSGDALTEGSYTIRVTPESGGYLILDAFGIYSETQNGRNAYVGPAAVTNESGALVSVLEDGQKLTVTMPVANTGAEALPVQVTAMLYSGAGLRQAVCAAQKTVTAAAGGSETVTLDVTVPTGSASMRLAILVTDAETGKPLNYPYQLDGKQIVDGEPVAVPDPKSDEIEMTYDAASGLATAALGGLASGKRAMLLVDGKLWQTAVSKNGVAAFVFAPQLTEAKELTLTVSAERAASRSRTITLDPASSLVDKNGLNAVLASAKILLDDAANEDKYTAASWQALKDAYAAAKTVAADDTASQTAVEQAIANLTAAISSLQVANVTELTYDPSAAAKDTFFHIYDKDGNLDAGNKDGGNGVWQARASQVDTTQAGAWFEMSGPFASFKVIGADKYDSANFIVKITDETTGAVTTEEITATKGRSGDVAIYEKATLPGTQQTIRIYNNEDGKYLEIRGIECTVVKEAVTTKVLEAAVAKAEALDRDAYLSMTEVDEAVRAAKAVLADENADQAQVDAAAEVLNQAVAALKQLVLESGTYAPSAAAKNTWFRIYDQNGNLDAGNKDGKNGVWQARASQVDTTQAGAWFEMSGKFTAFKIIGADKYDSANFTVKIIDETTGAAATEEITATKNRNGDVVIYEAANLTGQLVTIQVYNNENGRYLELRGIECAVAQPNTVLLTGPETVTIGDEAAYSVLVRHAENLVTATVTLQIDGLEQPVVEAMNGFFVIGQTYRDGALRVVLGNNQGLYAEPATEILRVTLQTGRKAAEASVELTGAIFSGYGEGLTEIFLPVTLETTQVRTQVQYSLYDVNQDGVVNQLDITRTQRAYGASAGDAHWNPLADVDGNGTVDISDMILIVNNYSK